MSTNSNNFNNIIDNVLAIGTPVQVVSDTEYPNPLYGVIIGHTVLNHSHNKTRYSSTQFVYIVELDKQIDVPERRTVITSIIADASCVYYRDHEFNHAKPMADWLRAATK